MTTPLACSPIHIVEDDDAVRQALVFLIESWGGTVVAHRSAEDYLAANASLSNSQTPACLLLDLHLGGQNGAELLEQLYRGHYPSPVIILTAHADGDLAERALRAGAHQVIEKPFRSNDLITAISDILESSSTP